MTANRARKNATRAAQQPGESYIAASRRLHTAVTPAPEVPTIARATAYGSSWDKQHAVAIFDWHRQAYNRVVYAKSLCGGRGGGADGGWLTTLTNQQDEPKEYAAFAPLLDDEDADVCADCAHRFRADYQDDAAETKPCKGGCDRVLPLNKFRPHKGRHDGLSGNCEDCRARLAKEREDAKYQAMNDQQAQRHLEGLRQTLPIVQAWQDDPMAQSFACSNGHVLGVEIQQKRDDRYHHLYWTCPCGTAFIERFTLDLARLRTNHQEKRGHHLFTPAISA